VLQPAPASRSFSSDRSRPAQKWSPSPSSTAARTVEGRVSKVSRTARIRPSLSALRLAAGVQADDGDVAIDVELEVGFAGHVFVRSAGLLVINNNQFKP
jgi:hypothetical protein